MRHRLHRLNQPLPLGLALSVTVLAGLPLACESQGPTYGGSGGRGGNGESCAVADQRWCGQPCEGPADCPTGMYCREQTMSCTADCLAGEVDSVVCGGKDCLSDGRCSDYLGVEGSGAGLNVDPGSGGQTGTGGSAACIEVKVDFDPVIPSVLFLIDRSLSMTAEEGFGQAVSAAIAAGEYETWDCTTTSNYRWSVVRNVLLNPDTGVVKPLEDKIRFGLSLYSYQPPGGGGPIFPGVGGMMGGGGVPGAGGSAAAGGASAAGGAPATGGTGGEAALMCPTLIDVDIALNNHAAMLAAFQCDDLLQDTPTRESLVKAAETLAGYPSDEPKVIVLATDGAPDNCHCTSWVGEPGASINLPEDCTQEAKLQEQADVVAEAARISTELGITVHVVDVSSPTQTELHDHLTLVAEAGQGEIFDGTNPGGLIDAFATITQGVQSCAIDLDGTIAPGKESTGKVTLDGELLEFNGPDGWKVNSPTQIELVGAACASTKMGESALDISFPCDAFKVK